MDIQKWLDNVISELAFEVLGDIEKCNDTLYKISLYGVADNSDNIEYFYVDIRNGLPDGLSYRFDKLRNLSKDCYTLAIYGGCGSISFEKKTYQFDQFYIGEFNGLYQLRGCLYIKINDTFYNLN